jgi:hypothetical protein
MQGYAARNMLILLQNLRGRNHLIDFVINWNKLCSEIFCAKCSSEVFRKSVLVK